LFYPNQKRIDLGHHLDVDCFFNSSFLHAIKQKSWSRYSEMDFNIAATIAIRTHVLGLLVFAILNKPLIKMFFEKKYLNTDH